MPEIDAEHQRESQVAGNVRLAGRGRNAGGVNDAEVVRPQSGSDPGFLEFLEQAFVEGAVGFHVALEQAVFDGTLVELVGFLLLPVEGSAQHGFTLEGGLIFTLKVVHGLVDLTLHLAIDFLELVIELRNFRIGGTKLRAEFGNLDAKVRLLLAQLVEEAGADFRRPPRRR